jgi:uncharacterized protein YdaU (DUF1376 family)
MKLYIADYLADTTHLNRSEHGAYLLLLMALWRAGGKLPRDPAKLARIAQCTPAEWEEIGPIVLDFFKVSGGSITQKRATREIAKYQGVVKGSKTAGKASAAKRTRKNNAEGPTDVEERLNGNPINQNHNQNQKEEPPKPPEGAEQLDLIGDAAEPPPDPVRQAFDQWNTLASEYGLPAAKDLTEARRRSIGKRLEASGPEGWAEALAAVKVSAFCLGQTKPRPDQKPFKADLDFVCQAKSFQRLREGYYGADGKAPVQLAPPAPNPDGPWRGRMLEWTQNRYWNALDWGPRPGHAGCQVPAHLLKTLEEVEG